MWLWFSPPFGYSSGGKDPPAVPYLLWSHIQIHYPYTYFLLSSVFLLILALACISALWSCIYSPGDNGSCLTMAFAVDVAPFVVVVVKLYYWVLVVEAVPHRMHPVPCTLPHTIPDYLVMLVGYYNLLVARRLYVNFKKGF